MVVPIVGYTDRLSVQPGERLCVMVSAVDDTFAADIVRLVSAETTRDGAGYSEDLVDAIVTTRHLGRVQPLRLGSYATIDGMQILTDFRAGIAFQAWILPTAPERGPQTLIAQGDVDAGGWAIGIDPARGLTLTLGGRTVAPDVPVRPRSWWFTAVSVDVSTSEATLVQRPTPVWPVEPSAASTRCAIGLPDDPSSLLLLAARRTAEGTTNHFNGRLDRPRLFAGPLTDAQIDMLFDGAEPDAIGAPVFAAWDFTREIPSDRIVDVGLHQLHGRLHQMPVRAVTDHTWNGTHHDWTVDPRAYGAIHFHDDDLIDAGWDPDVELTLPDDLPSGIYAVRLRGEEAIDRVPFFVRPPAGIATNRLLFLQSTNTHIAYANWHMLVDEVTARRRNYPFPYPLGPEQRYGLETGLLSLYDLHTDGSGVFYSSSRRPIMNLRPTMNDQTSQDGIGYAHGLKADLHVAGWLAHAGFGYDVATDEDLHREGFDLLRRYRAVMTGTHPEYWTRPMLEATEAYQQAGGRFISLGGNGFYWVTSFDPDRPHVIEVRRANGSRVSSVNAGEYRHSTTGEPGGIWREQGFPPQRISGAGFAGQGIDRAQPYRRMPGSRNPRAAWIFDGVEGETFGDAGLGMDGAAGFEIDRADSRLGTPPHALIVATATGFSDLYQHVIEEVALSNSLQGGTVEPRVRADMVFYETPNGGAVFATGSIAYGSSLPVNGYLNDVARVTENVVRRFLADGELR